MINKNMKLTIFLMIIFTQMLLAQYKYMVIKDKNNETIIKKVSDIEEITFVELTFEEIKCIDYDGNEYDVVKIGNQIWMAENLKTKHFNDGTAINDCWAFDDEESNVDTYGRLYSGWPASNEKLAPEGWHVATNDDWEELEQYLNSINAGTEGSQLAGRSDLWDDGALENSSVFGSSGFNAFPGGYKGKEENLDIYFSYSIEWAARFWTADGATVRCIDYDETVLSTHYVGKSHGFSIRCVKDVEWVESVEF